MSYKAQPVRIVDEAGYPVTDLGGSRGTPGTPSGPVQSVQGTSGGTPLAITNGDVVSPTYVSAGVGGNSTTATLLANATFTGNAESTLGFNALAVEVESDQASAVNGLKVQQSPDGTNWDIEDHFSILAATALPMTVPVRSSFYRIVYVNGAVNQTNNRIQVVKKVNGVLGKYGSDGVAEANQGQLVATSDAVEAVGTDRVLMNGASVAVQKGFANIAASQTDGAVVAAIAAKIIRVLAVIISAGATPSTVIFNTKPAGAHTAISMTFQPAANGGAVLPFCAAGWFDTASGDALTATTGAGGTTGIQVVYAQN